MRGAVPICRGESHEAWITERRLEEARQRRRFNSRVTGSRGEPLDSIRRLESITAGRRASARSGEVGRGSFFGFPGQGFLLENTLGLHLVEDCGRKGGAFQHLRCPPSKTPLHRERKKGDLQTGLMPGAKRKVSGSGEWVKGRETYQEKEGRGSDFAEHDQELMGA